jgi:hypothetical protein
MKSKTESWNAAAYYKSVKLLDKSFGYREVSRIGVKKKITPAFDRRKQSLGFGWEYEVVLDGWWENYNHRVQTGS